LSLCPVCNALIPLTINCILCENPLEDFGKVADFLDPYGHYNDIETVQSADGYAQNGTCPHLLYCEDCHHEQVVLIHEKPLSK